MEHNYLKEDHLRNIPVKFGKNPIYSFEEKFFEGKVYGRTHGRTDRRTDGRRDGHNAMTIARWISASGNKNRFRAVTQNRLTGERETLYTFCPWPTKVPYCFLDTRVKSQV